ncbi:MAG: bifunctional (p)ppGpp synthetase/guanosine-3',5'-bis(diphosphate) 3'-pyrophosphohydrolase [Ruminiclostridium sp.]|nr:bifunctional (p)ppGpp synthetase/guanosine-3',5'-bis(diphosphate) 3'-pyrophosphohydrolase [Ruminiclostridium sp.]
MTYTIEYLTERIKASEKAYDLNKITAAYELANEAHAGIKRSSGEPYIIHPIAVADILLDLFMDTDTLCAALLHDVVEDTDVPLETIRKKFGEDVANLVDGVTKIGQIPLNTTKEEQQAENIRKILIAMSKDIRVIIIKLADRLHNMRTIKFRPPEKQRKKALETMNFYAPIAHRLGMSAVKEEMEDISIRILDPFGAQSIEEMLDKHKEQRDTFIDIIKSRIRERISDIDPPPTIEGRVKSVYSIYKKVYVNGKNFDEIYDIYAVRVIVQTVIECYNVLGIIHDIFKPIPYRFKDYIATPKPNRYQSLHTTVIGREGIPFEVQIRTYEMHNTAQYGIAAHWKYKAGLSGNVAGEKRFDWIRHILEQQQDSDDINELADAIKVDLAPDDVYVFTPKGDVITLPANSTIIDFAYAIHTQIGNHMTGAKVGGRQIRFDYRLTTGDIVEIQTSENARPNRNWLEIAKTSEARAKIRSWFKRECREENITEGKNSIELEFRRNNMIPTEDFIQELAEIQHFDNIEDFYAAIGYGGVILSKIMQRAKDLYNSRNENKPAESSEEILSHNYYKRRKGGVVVEGIDNCLIKFAKCCNPLPGDDIIGFITRGYGVSVHKRDCLNVINSPEIDKERWINVMWAGGTENDSYNATIDIIAEDRTALIADITSVIAASRLPIRQITAHQLKNGNGNVIVTVEVASLEQLNAMIGRICKVQGVITAERTGIV